MESTVALLNGWSPVVNHSRPAVASVHLRTEITAVSHFLWSALGGGSVGSHATALSGRKRAADSTSNSTRGGGVLPPSRDLPDFDGPCSNIVSEWTGISQPSAFRRR